MQVFLSDVRRYFRIKNFGAGFQLCRVVITGIILRAVHPLQLSGLLCDARLQMRDGSGEMLMAVAEGGYLFLGAGDRAGRQQKEILDAQISQHDGWVGTCRGINSLDITQHLCSP